MLVLSLLFNSSSYAKGLSFSDTEGHWAEQIIKELVAKDIVAGFPDGTVRPDLIITRGEFIALLARNTESEITGAKEESPSFNDIDGHWSQNYIEALVDSSILDKADYTGRLQPDESITRIEMVKMIVRSIDIGEEVKQLKEDTSFKDDSEINKSDKGFVSLSVRYDLIKGYPDNTFRPKGETTRAEAFALLMRRGKVLDKIEKEIEKQKAKKEQYSDDNDDDYHYYPEAHVTFELPHKAHTDTNIIVTTVCENTKALNWSLTKKTLDGSEQKLILYEMITGDLSKEGGSIVFKESGSYTLTALATNYNGKVTRHSQSIEVLPVVNIVFELPEYTHTDKTISIDAITTGLRSLDIAWSVTKDGEAVGWDTAIEGTPNNEGGSITFKEKGSYSIIATCTDETGRSYTHTASIKVYPQINIDFQLPDKAHTDTTINMSTMFSESIEGLNVQWSLTRNGEEVAHSDYIEGDLTNLGGVIRFKEEGVYLLTATIKDITNRSFHKAVSTIIYPVGEAGFYLPEITHTDTTVTVEGRFKEVEDADVIWTLTIDNTMVDLKDYIEGELTNDGGSVRFTHKGEYLLKATFTDSAGRTYSYTSKVTVYPIPKLLFEQPSTAHTDTVIPVSITIEDMDNLPIEWMVDNTHGFQEWNVYVDGELNHNGGTIQFKQAGVYKLVARVTDSTGRRFNFDSENSTEVYSVLDIQFELPEVTHTDRIIDLKTMGDNNVLPIEWLITKDGTPVEFDNFVEGVFNDQGGKIRFTEKGEYKVTAKMMDALGRTFSHNSTVSVYPISNIEFTLPQTIHIGTDITISTKDSELHNMDILWEIKKDDETVEFDSYVNGTLTNSGGVLAFIDTGHYILIAKVTDDTGRVFTYEREIDINNNPPSKPLVTVDMTRIINNGKFQVMINTSSTDPDSDAITYEYIGKAEDNYYGIGTHTIQVRAKDEYGAYSEWEEATFTVTNQAPSTPIISRTPDGNSVLPSTPVTITAKSTDPEGDAISYIWEGRPSQTTTYPLGKNIIRVKAVDSAGAESPWTAIVFFVADPNKGGGMVLTGPESVIFEEGIEGATVTKYTFTVPPVSGHSGNDYGRVRGYNVKTGVWDQLSYGTTKNGITFSKTLPFGVYSQLEFYYYTNHNCMYNKSNITYSVFYHFE